MSGVRNQLGNLVDHPIVQRFIVFVLLLNALTLGLDTSPEVMEKYGDLITRINEIIPIIFVIEVGSRLIARGKGFFKESWNVFDIVIISISFLPSGSAFSALRALRILRVLHVISLVPRMRHVVAAMIKSLPQIGSIVALLLIISYISAVIVTHLYGQPYPELFGDIGLSMLTLFQLMTLEGWAAEVVRPVMETHPYSVFLFIPYMLMTAFAILNLFTAVLVDSMQVLQNSYAQDKSDHETAHVLHEELEALRTEMSEITRELQRMQGGPSAASRQTGPRKLDPKPIDDQVSDLKSQLEANKSKTDA